MKTQTIIAWNQATHRLEQNRRQADRQQAESLKEFMGSKCDLFDARDFQYYADKTGLSKSELYKIATYSDDLSNVYENAIIDEYKIFE